MCHINNCRRLINDFFKEIDQGFILKIILHTALKKHASRTTLTPQCYQLN